MSKTKHDPKVNETREGFYVSCPCGYLSVIYATRPEAVNDRNNHG